MLEHSDFARSATLLVEAISVEDRRRFQRFSLDCSMSIGVGPVEFETQLLNLSGGGALVVLPPDYRQATELFQVVLGSIELVPTVTIDVVGLVVHNSFNAFGIRFTSLDSRSASRLNRLIELNMGMSDVGVADGSPVREKAAMIHQNRQ